MLEPASAAAAAVCLGARIRFAGTDQAPITGRHPRRCGWCDYTIEELQAMLQGFELEDQAARAFRSMQPGRQREMVTTAQAIADEPEPDVSRPTSATTDGRPDGLTPIAAIIDELRPDAEPTWFDAPPDEATA